MSLLLLLDDDDIMTADVVATVTSFGAIQISDEKRLRNAKYDSLRNGFHVISAYSLDLFVTRKAVHGKNSSNYSKVFNETLPRAPNVFNVKVVIYKPVQHYCSTTVYELRHRSL